MIGARVGRCALLILAFAGWATAAGVEASQPTPPATIAFTETAPRLIRTPAGGVVLEVQITTARPGPYRLRVLAAPNAGSPVAAGRVSERIVQVDGRSVQQVIIPVRASGDIEATVVVEPRDGGVSAAATEFVRIAEDDMPPVAFRPEAYLPMRAREVAIQRPGYGAQPARPRPASGAMPAALGATAGRPPIEFVGGGAVTTAPGRATARGMKATLTSDTVVLTGQVVAQTSGGAVPMRNVSLQIWDSDTITPDDLLGTTTTDQQGNYSITVDNDDGAFGGGVDVYLYVSARQPTLAELQYFSDGRGGVAPFYYAWRSPTVDDIITPTATVSFQISEQASAASVWSGVSRAQYLQTSFGGHGANYVEVRYPGASSTGSYFNNDIINIAASQNAPETAGHEYGHAIMYQAYGGWSPSQGGPHSYCVAAPVGLAWSEGFATFIGLGASDQQGAYHWSVGDRGLSIENWSCAALSSMKIDEGRVAAGLWDLLDIPTDSNRGFSSRGRSGVSDANSGAQLLAYNQMLAALWLSHQADVTAYWANLSPGLTMVQQAPSNTIMDYNYYP